MANSDLESLLYTDEEFHMLYEISNGFNDDINRNSRVRDDGKTFSEFIDEGSDALIKEHSDLIENIL